LIRIKAGIQASKRWAQKAAEREKRAEIMGWFLIASIWFSEIWRAKRWGRSHQTEGAWSGRYFNIDQAIVFFMHDKYNNYESGKCQPIASLCAEQFGRRVSIAWTQKRTSSRPAKRHLCRVSQRHEEAEVERDAQGIIQPAASMLNGLPFNTR